MVSFVSKATLRKLCVQSGTVLITGIPSANKVANDIYRRRVSWDSVQIFFTWKKYVCRQVILISQLEQLPYVQTMIICSFQLKLKGIGKS